MFFKNYAENEAGKLVSDLFLSFKKAQWEVKTRGLQLSFVSMYFDSFQLGYTIKTNCIKL